MATRTARKNKQRMWYSLYLYAQTDYVLDDDGEKIILGYDSDGKPFYQETGTTTPVYGRPVEFKASISSNLNELHAREYGVDQSAIYSEIQCNKGYLPITFGTKIWRTNAPSWLDKENGIPDPDSAEYTVRGLLTEFLTQDWFLLQRDN